MEDTIAAISTALGIGGIAIIRMSGPESIRIANEIFDGKDLTKVKTHTIHYGHIVEENEIIDEVLVSVMLAPNTFTKENIIEINCHGGIATTRKILETVLYHGARLAEPGEFTKRAFLNGRIDLTEAEAVIDVIHAETESSLTLAINQLSGKVSTKIKELRQAMIEVLANIEVNIDYPEYEDIEEMTTEVLLPKLNNINVLMNQLLDKSENGQIVKNGIKTAIIGKPNVGKSSLLNILLEQEKAIVTSIPGTTRDIVEGTINLDGFLLNIIDTAGIRNTTDIVEEIGVRKSLEILKDADLVLYVLNGNEHLSNSELELLEEVKKHNYIIIINKKDLEQVIELDKLPQNNMIFMSTIKEEGLDELKENIKKLFHLEQISNKDLTYLTNSRSIALLKQANQKIIEAMESLKNDLPIDMIELDIKASWDLLGEIIGETYQDELINQLFSQFCLGK